MEISKDPILQQIGVPETNEAEYKFISIPVEIIKVIDANINLIWTMANYSKSVRPYDIILNAQQFFKSETLQLTDIFWKQHCASSLRELMDRHFENNVHRYLKHVPKQEDSEEAKALLKSLHTFRRFLNEYAHFRIDKDLLREVGNILGKEIDEIDNYIFDEICTGFLIMLYKYFTFKKR